MTPARTAAPASRAWRRTVGALMVASCAALAAGCDRHAEPAGDAPSPSASVVSLGVTLGACPDIEVCERECDAGSADRCRRLAVTYATAGDGGRDESRATALYERACAMGDPPACLFAGQMHEYAHGVPRDIAAASRFYERACGLHSAAGCYNQAIVLERYPSSPADRARAADLYAIACKAGAREACAKAEALRDAGGANAAPSHDE